LVAVFRDQVICSATKTENGTKHPKIEIAEQTLCAKVPFHSWNFKEEIVNENKLKDMFYSQLSKTKIVIPVLLPPGRSGKPFLNKHHVIPKLKRNLYTILSLATGLVPDLQCTVSRVLVKRFGQITLTLKKVLLD